MLLSDKKRSFRPDTIYDAVLVKSAAKADVERIYTLNQKHFQAVVPGSLAARILSP
jgi:hypothetical protein